MWRYFGYKGAVNTVAGKTDCHVTNPTAKCIHESADVNSSAEYLVWYLAVISKLSDHADQIAPN